MNKDKILELCDEIENTLSDAWNRGAIEYELAGHIVSFAKKIAAEITAPPKSNGDRIRQMKDEELASFLDVTCGCSVCFLNAITECTGFKSSTDCIINKMRWLKQEVSLLDRLAAEYERKHPDGVKFTHSLDVEVRQTEPVRHGRWIPIEHDSFADGAPVWDKYECSECGHEHSGEEDTLTAFCPDCGADMREECADSRRTYERRCESCIHFLPYPQSEEFDRCKIGDSYYEIYRDLPYDKCTGYARIEPGKE